MNLGLRPSNFNFIYKAPSLLKRDLLYFDQVHICSHGKIKVLDELEFMDPEYYNIVQKEFDFLYSKGLLCDFNLSEMMKFSIENFKGNLNDIQGKGFFEIYKGYTQIPNPFVLEEYEKYKSEDQANKAYEKYIQSVNQSENEVTRISSALLNLFAAKDKSFPLLQNDNVIGVDPFYKSKVLEVVLEKLPIPDENIEWQRIIEYRSDPDSQGKFNELRVWMQDISRKDYTKDEIEERIKYLMHEYESHLKLHKLKYSHGTIRILVTTSLDVLENAVKLKWGTVAKSLFSLKEKEYDLLQADMNAPGKEVAYLTKTNNIFK